MSDARAFKLWVTAGGALVLWLVGAALFGSTGVAKHEQLRGELARVEALNDRLRGENGRLAVEARALKDDPGYIESVIRDELGWVGPSDLVFIFPTDPEKSDTGEGAD